MLHIAWWIYGIRPIDDGRPIEAEKTVSNSWSRLPVVHVAFEVSIEEFLQVIVG
jgi:hypothetical protein